MEDPHRRGRVSDSAHLIAAGHTVRAYCPTCRWEDADPGGWIGASHAAMDHVNETGHAAWAMEQNSAIYAAEGDRLR